MDRKITLGTMCTCKGMRHCEEEHANIECESWDHGAKEELGWQAGNQNPRSPQSPENGYIYCILFIRTVFCHMSNNSLLHCLSDVTMNIFHVPIFILHVTLSRFCLCLLICITLLTHFHIHIQRHTHKHTCMISTQEEWRQPGTGAWLGGAEERLETKA